MATRSAVLAAWNVPAANEERDLVVPPGEVWLVKTIQVHNQGAAAGLTLVSLQRPADSVNCNLFHQDVAAGELHMIQTWAVLEAGDRMALYSAAVMMQFWVSGTKLTVG